MAKDTDNQVYRVVMDGYFLADTSKTQVIRKLRRLFGITEEKMLNMFDGQPTIIKSQLPKHKAYQYLRTITNAGAACHIDRLHLTGPEETTQLPVHIERFNDIDSFDPLDKIKRRIQDRNDFSEVMRLELMEMDQVRKKSDLIITTLFISLFLILIAAVIFLFLF
ncbi:MAG: hypothetical protein U9N50_13340 [Pseudomonadota bacterium]|nr:hypothetical protein [Pseudomonadota bacterium]